MKKITLFCSSTLLVMLMALSNLTLAGDGKNSWSAEGVHAKAFVENKGQFRLPKSSPLASPVLFAYDAGSTRIFFTKTGVSYYFAQKTKKENEIEKDEKFKNLNDFLEKEKEEKAAAVKTDEVSFTWAGANPNVQLVAGEEAEGSFSYSFLSNGKEKNITGINGYKKISDLKYASLKEIAAVSQIGKALAQSILEQIKTPFVPKGRRKLVSFPEVEASSVEGWED